MLGIRKVYPGCKEENDYFYAPSDYEPLLASFGYDILLQLDDEDYSGDSYLVFKDDKQNRIGYLIFGWGSCSGCDALQACNSYMEIDKLRIELYKQIKWFKTPEEMLKYFNEKDWKEEWFYHDETGTKFVKKAIEILKKEE